MAGKYLGKDGIYYDSYKEMYNTNREMKQRDEQNRLLREQNKLKEEQNKLLKQQNNSNNYSSSSNIPLTEFDKKAFDSIGLGENMSSTNPIISKFNDIKFALFLHTFGIIIIFFIANAGVIDSFLYYCLRIGTGNTGNKIGLGIFAVYLMYYIFLFIKKLKYKKLSIKEIEKQKIKEDSEENERKAQYDKIDKETEDLESELYTMLDINKFCASYNENLKKYYKLFGENIENEQLENTDINSYCVNNNSFHKSEKDSNLNLNVYTAIKNDIKIVLTCNKKGIIVSSAISKTENIDTASNELVKRIFLPFLSTITSQHFEDSIITWRAILDNENWTIKDDEFSYSLTENYVFMITNLIFINLINEQK